MSEDRFPYLKNFLNPTKGVGAKSDKTHLCESFRHFWHRGA